MQRPALLSLLLLMAGLSGACDEDESCQPVCRPAADGKGVEIVLPCESPGFTEETPCHVEFNSVDVEGEARCTDVIKHRCAIRTYDSGQQYRICVVEAVVIGAQEYEIEGELCDLAWIDVRVDRRKTADELPEGCEPVPDDFCDVAAIGYSFCGYETSGCHWPPNPYR